MNVQIESSLDEILACNYELQPDGLSSTLVGYQERFSVIVFEQKLFLPSDSLDMPSKYILNNRK